MGARRVESGAGRGGGFTLVELLVVMGVIGLLVAMLMPALRKARESAVNLQCANNLRQIGMAMVLYANNNKGAMFWRGADLGRDGMDWYAYGGRETGNKYVGAQGNFFNQWVPRPLNRYVGGSLKVFECPEDTMQWDWAQDWTCVEWVGTSYQFNANGCPYVDHVPDVDGLAGVKMSAVRGSSQTIMFLDAPMGRGVSWHGRARGNICFVDGHVAMLQIPWEERTQDYEW